MKKNGFTLIELATVVTIMAMIALIATPIVINVIDNVRKGSIEKSVANIEHAAEVYYYNQKMNNAFSGITFKCGDGACRNGDQILTLNGQVPEDGYVKIDKDGNISLKAIEIKGYGCSKETDKYNCVKIEKTDSISTNNSLLTFDSELGTLSNYKIYGNSVFLGESLVTGISYVQGYFDSVTTTITSNSNNRVYYIPCEPNTTYKIIRKVTNDFNHIGETTELPSVGSTVANITKSGETMNTVIYTTSATAKYIVLRYREQYNNIVEYTYDELLSATYVSISEETPTTGDIENVGNLVRDKSDSNYGKYEIPIKVTGKNLFNENNVLENTKITQDDEGYKVSAYPAQFGSASSLIRRLKESLIPGVTYTLSKKADTYDLKNVEGSVRILSSGTIVVNVRYGTGISSASFSMTEEQINNINLVYIYGNGTTPVLFEYFQLEVGDKATDYEPYREENYSIYLDEPLRCVENVCDYIDYKSSMLVRNVGVNKNGTLYTLSQPTFDDIDLPEIKINKGINNIFINTDISPNNFEIEYYK